MMVQFETSRFGTLEVPEDRIIEFPEGIPGFRNIKRYILIDYKDTPLKWLQAVDDPDVAFLVVEPLYIKPDYKVEIDPRTMEIIGLEDEKDMAVLLIIRVENQQVIANLNGPLILNASKKKGFQMLVD